MSGGRPCSIIKTYSEVSGTDYTILTITSKEYEYNTVVDTKIVKYLELFSWSKLNTDDGIYFCSTNNNESHRECITKLKLPFEYGKQLLLHRLVAYITQLENPNNYTTVDHINRQTLDNRSKNLRWLSQANQNRNTDKRKRKTGAKPLPDDIEGPLPKYLTWNLSVETTKAGKVLERKFFRIEKHPAQNEKTWTTTKASTISNQDKLNQALEKLSELDKFLEPEDPLREQLLKEYNELIIV